MPLLASNWFSSLFHLDFDFPFEVSSMNLRLLWAQCLDCNDRISQSAGYNLPIYSLTCITSLSHRFHSPLWQWRTLLHLSLYTGNPWLTLSEIRRKKRRGERRRRSDMLLVLVEPYWESTSIHKRRLNVINSTRRWNQKEGNVGKAGEFRREAERARGILWSVLWGSLIGKTCGCLVGFWWW